MTKNYNNTGPLEELLNKISEMELHSQRKAKYGKLVAEAKRRHKIRKRTVYYYNSDYYHSYAKQYIWNEPI